MIFPAWQYARKVHFLWFLYFHGKIQTNNFLLVSQDPTEIKANHIDANHVHAQRLEADHIFSKGTICSQNADIAYHFQLHNSQDTFEEGEIVCFMEDADTNELKIEKMHINNAPFSPLKGVVSKSFYFDAKKPVGKNYLRYDFYIKLCDDVYI